LELGEFIIFGGSGDLASIWSLLKQFRQPCEIDRNLSRLVDHREACRVQVGPAVENAELPASGIIDSISVWDFDDPPRPGKAVGHRTGLCRSGIVGVFWFAPGIPKTGWGTDRTACSSCGSFFSDFPCRK